MFLSQKYLQIVTFIGIMCFACLAASENTQNERSVAEAQLMHDKGKTIEEISRQRWLQGLLGSVHNPGRRNVPLIKNFRRDLRRLNEEQQRFSSIRNIRNLQYKQAILAHNKNLMERDP
ncbi:hypothetical protein XENTR_v10005427 [Xenopus tropicalis]|uniref:Parathyroid hormone 4-like n=1 Tax=Xenopus tropicalis TaxID=8364 RepID=A0A8J1J6K9_XENTR|nr:parathyroid hormone 4-like [Xenopus tropicalis]KAE8622920.1 hypothetical protein XENTR_v10005427 [Xenopus tropicalis]